METRARRTVSCKKIWSSDRRRNGKSTRPRPPGGRGTCSRRPRRPRSGRCFPRGGRGRPKLSSSLLYVGGRRYIYIGRRGIFPARADGRVCFLQMPVFFPACGQPRDSWRTAGKRTAYRGMPRCGYETRAEASSSRPRPRRSSRVMMVSASRVFRPPAWPTTRRVIRNRRLLTRERGMQRSNSFITSCGILSKILCCV